MRYTVIYEQGATSWGADAGRIFPASSRWVSHVAK